VIVQEGVPREDKRVDPDSLHTPAESRVS
jgi:hypothetical protein